MPHRVSALATALGVDTTELTRGLTRDEQRVWTFYRACAANPRRVWEAARTAWTAGGLDDKQAAAVMGVSSKVVASAARRPFALSFAAALRLTTALNIPGGPEALLPSPEGDSHDRTC
jgi:hypothetical protein